jgi:DNA polymerase-4
VSARIIMHADVDAFFASVEQAVNPAHRNKPVIVGGSGDRSVVMAASYEARRFGVHSAMPMSQARRLCPHAVHLPANGELYRRYSRHVMRVFLGYTPLVEPISIDEAYLDITGTERLFGPPLEVARMIKQRISSELGITVSIGMGRNRLLAKLASDWDKPDGLRWIRDEQLPHVLDELPVERLPGIGQVAAGKLRELGVRTVGQLRSLSSSLLEQQFGKSGAYLYSASRGEGNDGVSFYSQPPLRKQVSEETTLAEDSADLSTLHTLLLEMADNLARRLRKQGMLGRTVMLKIRFPNFKTVSRSATLLQPADTWQPIYHSAVELLEKLSLGGRFVRLIGIGVTNLCDQTVDQLSLFGDERAAQVSRLDAACDELVRRYGNGAITQARRLR